jgi:putative peptidoglycan lipid II flippase
LGLAAGQINLLIITIIGSTLASGSIGVLNWANDLSWPLIGLIAIPFSTAVFPVLSLDFAKGDKKDFILKFSSVFRQLLFWLIPLSALSFILRAHLVRIVYGAGLFDWSATKLTAACFGIFMFSLLAQGLIYLLAKAFYSMRNTKTPALVSVISVLSTAVFALFFVWLMKFENLFSLSLAYFLKIEGMKNIAVIALPLAILFDAFLQLFLLLFFFKKQAGAFQEKEILSSLKKVLIATFFAVTLAYFVRQLLGGYEGSQTFLFLFLQTGAAGISGLLTYILIGYFFGLAEVKSLRNFFLSQIGLLANHLKNRQ